MSEILEEMLLTLVMSNKFIGRTALAKKWDKHPTTVVRIFRRHGVTGLKSGQAMQSSRMFEMDDVLRVEKLLRLNARDKGKPHS